MSVCFVRHFLACVCKDHPETVRTLSAAARVRDTTTATAHTHTLSVTIRCQLRPDRCVFITALLMRLLGKIYSTNGGTLMMFSRYLVQSALQHSLLQLLLNGGINYFPVLIDR